MMVSSEVIATAPGRPLIRPAWPTRDEASALQAAIAGAAELGVTFGPGVCCIAWASELANSAGTAAAGLTLLHRPVQIWIRVGLHPRAYLLEVAAHELLHAHRALYAAPVSSKTLSVRSLVEAEECEAAVFGARVRAVLGWAAPPRVGVR